MNDFEIKLLSVLFFLAEKNNLELCYNSEDNKIYSVLSKDKETVKMIEVGESEAPSVCFSKKGLFFKIDLLDVEKPKINDYVEMLIWEDGSLNPLSKTSHKITKQLIGTPISSELEYEVIEKGSAGFLGIGMKQAVIKARKKVQEPVVEAEPEPVPVPTSETVSEPEPISEPEPAPVQEVAPVAQPVSKPETKPAPLTNYLPRAIVMSILLFPTGIAAIVHAAKAQTAYIQGQYDLAERENELAARWCKKTVIAGIIFWAAFILFYMILIIAALA